jgi:hypothetical protein
MSQRRASIAATGIAATALVLAGCAPVGVHVGSPQGLGLCGADPITLGIEQSDAGDQVGIEYNGPSNVSLVAYQGSYSDSRFFGNNPTESRIVNYPSSDLEAPFEYAVNALDFEVAPWTSTPTGASTVSVDYEGSIADLLDSFDYTSTAPADTGSGHDKMLPVTIAVICEGGFTSRVLEDPTLDSDEVIDSDEFDVAIAQAFFPNFMYTDPPTVTRQKKMRDGVSGRMELPPEIVDAMPADLFTTGVVSVGTLFLGETDPYGPAGDDLEFSLSDATPGDLWDLWYNGTLPGEEGAPEFTLTGDMQLAGWIPFEFTGTPKPDDGYYLFSFTVEDAEENPENVKMATSVLQYSSERGLALSGLIEPPADENIAVTGGDPNVIIWAVLGGLVVLAAVFLRPKRRKTQAESTIDPSARKE